MVANRYLTEYQASLLARGHADGFFLGDYKIMDRLGKGRMAGVYKGQYRLGQIVAIKVLPPSKAKEPNLLARFQREAKLAIRLKHPNIVRSFQTGVADGLNFLVMEYLEGETLEDVLAPPQTVPAGRGGPPDLPGAAGIAAHPRAGAGPSRSEAGQPDAGAGRAASDSTLGCTVKILDIGLGRALFEDRSRHQQDAGLTGEGVLLGTPDYMAPEQARDPRSTDIRADIYSLGCVLFHLPGRPAALPRHEHHQPDDPHATEPPRR